MIFQEVSVSSSQYAGLPGIINERFFAVCDINGDLAVQEDEFVKTFTQVFVSDIDAKIGLTFKMYGNLLSNSRFNFKKDGKISKEEVRLVLSYSPIRQKSELV